VHKVFALPSHAVVERTSGVDFARVIQPMQHLDKEKDFKIQLYDPKLNDKLDWVELIPQHDILFLNYTTNPWAFAIMGTIARKENRQIVMDIDDALWEVLPDNTAYEVFKKKEVKKTLTAICNEVDYVTCTNKYLKKVILDRTTKRYDEVIVMPNFIDLDLYKYRSPFKDSLDIKLLHFGSSSHFSSLQEVEFEKGLNRILGDYPNVTFKTIGSLIPKYKNRWGQRYSHGFGDVDVYKWIQEKFPTFLEEADIMVVPLTNNIYNKGKSCIKFIEASSAIKPGVWQNIRQYSEIIQEGENGFLAETEDEWYDAIKKLVESASLRKSIAKKAFETVQNGWQMKDNTHLYADFFRKILDRK